MAKRKIPNLKDQFEDVLLYTSGYEKVRDKVDPKWLKDHEFCRVVRYMTMFFYRKNQGLLSTLGYDESDVHTIIQMYSLRFMAKDYAADNARSRYMFLMRHLSQRFPRFRSLLERKYAMKDVLMIGVDDLSWHSKESEPAEDSDLSEMREERAEIRANLKKLTVAIRNARSDEDRESLRLERHAVQIDLLAASEEIRILSAKRRREQEDNQEITRKLRERLGSLSKDELTDKMAYYATIRAVSHDVRDSARAFCRKNGIDYARWAKKYIETHNFDESEFVF